MQPKANEELRTFARQLHELASLSKESFDEKAKHWLGRDVALLGLGALLGSAKDGKLHRILAKDTVELGLDLQIIKTQLRPEDPTRKIIKQIYAFLKPDARVVSDFPPQVTQALNLGEGIIENWWDKGHIVIQCEGEAKKTLAISPELAQCLTEELLEKILQSQPLQTVTHFDFTTCPGLSSGAPAIVKKYCPQLDCSCFRYLADDSLLLDHNLLVDGKSVPINKQLVAHFSEFFRTMWASGMAESRSTSTTLPTSSVQSVQDCMNALIGIYDIASETDASRLYALMQEAHLFQLYDLVNASGRRILDLFEEGVNVDDGTEEVGLELKQICALFRPLLNEEEVEACRERICELAFRFTRKHLELNAAPAISENNPAQMLKTFRDYNLITCTRFARKTEIERYRSKELYGPVLETFELLAHEFPDDAEILFILGKIHCDKAHYTKGKESLEKAIALNPNNHEAVCHLADLLYRGAQGVTRDPHLAIELLEDILDTGKAHYLVFITYAHLLLKEGKFAAAVHFLDQFEGERSESKQALSCILSYFAFLLATGHAGVAPDPERAKRVLISSYRPDDILGIGFHFAAWFLLYPTTQGIQLRRSENLFNEFIDKAGFFEEPFVEQIMDNMPLTMLRDIKKLKRT
jgi:tetratricopeptide (TPR) repeat protein